jgi:pyruvate dehydrogenase E2 component (dihydrolipoamide acetyltransferase)
MRKVIAKRLAESKFTAPHYYLNMEIDMDNCIRSRNSIKESHPDSKISYNDIIVKACAMALRRHPQVNSTWDTENTIVHGNINIGVAVAVDEGLLVPVVRNTDYKTLSEISAEVRDLAGRARERKINANEMEGSTFTVSNLGMFGIESFTSIINQPNSCILSVGAIVEKPVVKNGEIVPGHTMKLSLACDHRTVDGATGAKFLQTLESYLKDPVSMLV